MDIDSMLLLSNDKRKTLREVKKLLNLSTTLPKEKSDLKFVVGTITGHCNIRTLASK